MRATLARFRSLLLVVMLMFALVPVWATQEAAADERSLTISAATVSCWDSVTLHGAGFTPGAQAIAWTGGADKAPSSIFLLGYGPETVRTDGTFDIASVTPWIDECLGLPAAPILISAGVMVDRPDTNGWFAVTDIETIEVRFSADPNDARLTLSALSGPACQALTLYGENFVPGSTMFITAAMRGSHVGGQATVDYPIVDANGRFSVALDALSHGSNCFDLTWIQDGGQVIIGATTGDPKRNDPPGPHAAVIYTIQMSPAERFQQTWARDDVDVWRGIEQRSWAWGDQVSEILTEDYAESPGGERLVQYWDKSRMEINQPDGDRTSVWYVTNGLLVVEMVEGRVQVGDDAFVPTAGPADFSIAGDPGAGAPTYADVARYDLTERSATTPGTLMTQAFNPATGAADAQPAYGQYGVHASVYVQETDHTVASVFWDFMAEISGEQQQPFYATGFPITEAYWTTVAVAGTPTDVLWQCFERRCLTYTPANAEPWQVESGNVGQHYYEWRYGTE